MAVSPTSSLEICEQKIFKTYEHELPSNQNIIRTKNEPDKVILERTQTEHMLFKFDNDR